MRFVVSGDSMEPAYPAGSRLLVSKLLRVREGDAVVLRDPRDGRLILKRLKGISEGMYFVEGDNPKSSTDSRHFGPVKKKFIIGRVMFSFSKKKRWLLFAVFVLGLIGLADASYLTYDHYQHGESLCSVVPGSCDLVTGGEYAVVFGIPLAVLGVFFYAGVLALAFLYKKKRSKNLLNALGAWTGIGFLTSFYLTYLQAFEIRAYCLFCLSSAVTSTALFILVLFLLRKESKGNDE